MLEHVDNVSAVKRMKKATDWKKNLCKTHI